MKLLVFLVTIAFCLLFAVPVQTEMSSTDFLIFADVIDVVDVGPVTSSDFTLYSTLGEAPATSTLVGSLEMRAGFQAMERGGLGFVLSTTTISLGTLSTSAVANDSLTLTVTTDSATGYSVTITEDGDLRDGAGNTINDVSDGAVSAGSEEYGIQTSGPAGQLAGDTAIDGSVTVANTSGAATLQDTTVQFNAAIDSNTTAGTYSHQVTFTVVVNP